MGTTLRSRGGPPAACLPRACAPAREMGAMDPTPRCGQAQGARAPVGRTPRQEHHARLSRLRTGPDGDTPAPSCSPTARADPSPPPCAARPPGLVAATPGTARTPPRLGHQTTAATRGARGHGVPRRRSAPRPPPPPATAETLPERDTGHRPHANPCRGAEGAPTGVPHTASGMPGEGDVLPGTAYVPPSAGGGPGTGTPSAHTASGPASRQEPSARPERQRGMALATASVSPHWTKRMTPCDGHASRSPGFSPGRSP
jgi:hypothetical protein